jgi:hypothetical protein
MVLRVVFADVAPHHRHLAINQLNMARVSSLSFSSLFLRRLPTMARYPSDPLPQSSGLLRLKHGAEHALLEVALVPTAAAAARPRSVMVKNYV